MASPVKLSQLEQMMRVLGWTDIHYVPGAQNADRPGVFDPIGVTVHITAGGLGSRTVLQYIRDIINGDPGVPLKSNQVGAPDGACWMNAAGNTNHCLYFGPKVIPTLLGAGFSRAGSQNLRGSLTKWSPRSYGMELIAAHKPTSAQRRMVVIWAAALCILHGWSAGRVHGHGEVAYDRGFGDPNLDMGLLRRDVQAVIDKYRRGDTPKPLPTSPAGDVTPAPIQEDPLSGISRTVIEGAQKPHVFPLKLEHPGRWEQLPAGPNGWQTIVGLPSRPLHLWGETALTIQLPENGWARVRHFAWSDDRPKGKERVYTWPDAGSDRMHEIVRSISTVLNPGARLGIEVMVSHPALVTRVRSEFNVVNAK